MEDVKNVKENLENNKKNLVDVYNKHDIMVMFKCESDKALKILKIMYQMKMANKIRKEYYVERESLIQFLAVFKGQEILI